MTAKAILKQAASAGVTITLTPSGDVKVRGEKRSVSHLIDIVQANKTELVGFLQSDVVEPTLKPCPLCHGVDFIHGHDGGYFCRICQPDFPSGVPVRAGHLLR